MTTEQLTKADLEARIAVAAEKLAAHIEQADRLEAGAEDQRREARGWTQAIHFMQGMLEGFDRIAAYPTERDW